MGSSWMLYHCIELRSHCGRNWAKLGKLYNFARDYIKLG